MSFQQIGQLPQQAAPLRGCQARPRAILKSLAGCLYSLVDIFAVAFGDHGQNLAGGRIEGGEGLARSGIDPLAVDEHFAGFFQKFVDPRIEGKRRNCHTHSAS